MRTLLLFICLLFSVASYSQFTQVQKSAIVTGTTVLSKVITLSPTTANNLVVVHTLIPAGVTVTSITDDKGNAYVVGSAVLNNNSSYQAWQSYGVQTTGGTTSITVNFSASSATVKSTGAEEYSGGETTNAAIIDVRGSASATATSITSSTITPAAAGELIVCTGGVNASRTWTAGTGYTLYLGTNPNQLIAQYKLSGTTSEAPSMSISGAGARIFIIAQSYKAYTAPSTSIKTCNGLAKASVKNVKGLAIASVKSVNGLQ